MKNKKDVNSRSTDFKSAYDAGFDCGKHGSDIYNCHFKWFGTPLLTKEWERGERVGMKETDRHGH